MNWLIRQWYSAPNFFTYCFAPFSGLYRFIVTFRRWLYQKNILKTHKFPVPIIIVGNITVGGTGKTPLVIALVNFLQQQGYRPGIVSRGYGGHVNHYPYRVTAESDPTLAGDEAVLIAQKISCPIMIAPDRPAAVKELLKNNDCNLIISDDGMQHYALARDIEIAVIDGERRLGNGFCLPAGPLREPEKRLKQVDFVVTNGKSEVQEFSMYLLPDKIYNLLQTNLFLDKAIIQQQPIHAVAGIGNPQRFFTSLRELGFTIIEHPFPDHHRFQPEDLNFGKNAIIIMTEKDAVKCRHFASNNFWCLPVTPAVDKRFFLALLQKLKNLTH